MAGDDEETAKFRSDETEEGDGVDDAVVPVLSVGVEDVEEVEGVTRVCSARTETRHSPLSTAALRSAASPHQFADFGGERREKRREEMAAVRGREGLRSRVCVGAAELLLVEGESEAGPLLSVVELASSLCFRRGGGGRHGNGEGDGLRGLGLGW